MCLSQLPLVAPPRALHHGRIPRIFFADLPRNRLADVTLAQRHERLDQAAQPGVGAVEEGVVRGQAARVPVQTRQPAQRTKTASGCGHETNAKGGAMRELTHCSSSFG